MPRKQAKQKLPNVMIYSVGDRKSFNINDLQNINIFTDQNGRYRITAISPYGKKINSYLSKEGTGLLGNLFGRPDGELFPGAAKIPLLGALL